MALALYSRFRRLRWPFKLAIIAGALFVLYLGAMGLLLPYAAEKAVESQLPGVIHRQVSVQDVDYNPFTHTLTVHGVGVRDPVTNATLASIRRVFLDLEPSSLYKLAVEVRTLRIERPRLHILKRADGTLNISDLYAGQAGTAPEPEPEEKSEEAGLFPFILQNFAIVDGEVVLEDETTGKRFVVEHVDLRAPFTSSLEKHVGDHVKPRFSAVVNGDPVNFDGRVLPFKESLATRFDLHLWGIRLEQYWPYVPLPGRGLDLKSGLFSMNASLSFEQTGAILPEVGLAGFFELDNVALAGPDGRDRLGLVSLKVNLADVGILDRRVHVASIEAETP
ncbi:MAG: DUF748 domain-containing protein [Desulfovibrionaceae bacterium]